MLAAPDALGGADTHRMAARPDRSTSMKTRAAVHVQHGQPLAVEEVELADPGPEEVLVKLFASGICHSQLHQLHNPAQATPALLGHEATGVVLAKGREVDHVHEGDHVIVTWVPRDSTEEARPRPTVYRFRGEEQRASGIYTWAEHVLAHEQLVLPLDPDVPVDVTAIIGCAVVTGVGAVLGTAKVQPGQTVAVFGVGGVGINVLAGAKIAQAGRIIAVDLEPSKLDYAREFGATDCIDARDGDPVEAIQELTGGGVDFAFDAIGHEVTMQQIVAATKPGVLGVRRGGTAVLIGIPQGPVTFNARLFTPERSFIGSLGGSSHPIEDYPQYVQWFKEGALPLDKMVTKTYEGLDSINEGVAALERGEIRGRSIMVYDRP
ncbi:MAG: zinc-binding dehydrogenase [Dehalococcoidia bacterium]|nr:zinc-binding dehydrogenase [Dehalococcoidia bacterium]